MTLNDALTLLFLSIWPVLCKPVFPFCMVSYEEYTPNAYISSSLLPAVSWCLL